jgi:hypothetical protein
MFTTIKPKTHGQQSPHKSDRYGKPTFAGIPRACRHKIIENSTISSLLSLYNSCSNLHHAIPHSATIVHEVFSRVHDFASDQLPPTMEKVMAADEHLHPLFAKAIAESYDGYDFDGFEHSRVSGCYLVFLVRRCAVVHEIDVRFSRINASIVGGVRRKMALLTFWRMLDCIKNWTQDKKTKGLGGDIQSEEYFGWCVDIVGGFKYMVRSDEEKADICDAVSFLYNLSPATLVKGWPPGRLWSYLGWRGIMIGFCLLDGLERVAEALDGQYYLTEMRGGEGLELQISRGVARWIEFELREREKKRVQWEMQIELEDEEMRSEQEGTIDISDDSDDDPQPNSSAVLEEEAIQLSG